MANHPDSRSRVIIRSYGIVQEITKAGDVIIGMADGSLIKQPFNTIAVFIQPPSNWQELLEQQVVFIQPKNQMTARSPITKQRQN